MCSAARVLYLDLLNHNSFTVQCLILILTIVDNDLSHYIRFYVLLLEYQTNDQCSSIIGLHHVKYDDLTVLLVRQYIHLLQRHLMVHQQ